MNIIVCVTLLALLIIVGADTAANDGGLRPNLTAIIGVISAAGNYERRAAIRATWAKPSAVPSGVAVWFVLGNVSTAAGDGRVLHGGAGIFTSGGGMGRALLS